MVTQDRLKELFKYSADTGLLVKRKPHRGSVKVGWKQKAGYISTKIDKKSYLVHRLIFLYVYGHMPKYIDHINRVRDDNRISNLRSATIIVNSRNRCLRHDNTSGKTGVTYRKHAGNYQARIYIEDKRISLGCFKTKEEAIAAREAAEEIYGYLGE